LALAACKRLGGNKPHVPLRLPKEQLEGGLILLFELEFAFLFSFTPAATTRQTDRGLFSSFDKSAISPFDPPHFSPVKTPGFFRHKSN